MTDKPGLPVRFSATASGVVAVYDKDGNSISVAATQRLWIDQLLVGIASDANDYAAGSIGPLDVLFTGGSGKLYFHIAAPDSVSGSSAPAVNCSQTFPGSGFGLVAGDSLIVTDDVGPSAQIYVSGVGRIRPSNEG